MADRGYRFGVNESLGLDYPVLTLDVADVEAHAARVEALGVTRVGRTEEFGIHWVTLLDPEGNEFCLVVS